MGVYFLLFFCRMLLSKDTGVRGLGLALIQRFLKNTFWNSHIICSSKICSTPLIHFLFCIHTVAVIKENYSILSKNLKLSHITLTKINVSQQKKNYSESIHCITTAHWHCTRLTAVHWWHAAMLSAAA